MTSDYGTREHVWEPACPGGSLCRYCGEERDSTLHVLPLHHPDVAQAEQSVPLAVLDHTSDRGAMLTTLVQLAEQGLQRYLQDHELRARGPIVLTVNLRVEAS